MKPRKSFADSAETSYSRLRKVHNGRYNTRPTPTSPVAPPLQPPDAQRPGPAHPDQPPGEREAAVAAAIALGIPAKRARALAAQTSGTASDILKFILTH